MGLSVPVGAAELDVLDQAVHGELAGDAEFPEPPEFDIAPPPDAPDGGTLDADSPWDLPPPDETAVGEGAEEQQQSPPAPVAAQIEQILEDTQELGRDGSRARREWQEMVEMVGKDVERHLVAEATDEEAAVSAPILPVSIQDIVIFNTDDFDDPDSDEQEDHHHHQQL